MRYSYNKNEKVEVSYEEARNLLREGHILEYNAFGFRRILQDEKYLDNVISNNYKITKSKKGNQYYIDQLKK